MSLESSTSIYDVLNNFIQLSQHSLPIIGTLGGILVGKWIEQKNESKKLTRDIYLNANRALKRYSHAYMDICAYPNIEGLVERLNREIDLLEEARADLEVFGTDEACTSFSKVLNLTVKCGREALAHDKQGRPLKDPQKDIPSYKEYLNSLPEWNRVVRKDLKAL